MPAVFDLHCDLLYYLTAAPRRTPLDRVSRCGLEQLGDGGVALQVLAIYTSGDDDAVNRGLAQVAAYQGLVEDYPHAARPVRRVSDLPSSGEGAWPIAVMPAIENASGFCSNDEPLEKGLRRLEVISDEIGPLLYVSLTWKGENRFGGGDAAPEVGLTDDGSYLLEVLSDLGIAVDLSHASDKLAEDVLTFIDTEGLPLVPVASHSNLRSVTQHARNLPDELAQEIVARGGVIGLNLVRGFVGARIEDLARHMQRGLALGLGPGLTLGTDFFWEGDLASAQASNDPYRFFFPRFGDATCHPRVQEVLSAAPAVDESVLRAVCYRNARRFIQARLDGF